MSPAAGLRTFLGDLLAAALGRLPPRHLAGLVVAAAARRAATLAPAEALRFLMNLDARLYPLAGRHAVAYGGGVHPKHRHTGYHDFFVARCGPADRVLEVGCGTGALASDVAVRSGAQVLAVDLEPANIEAARRHHGDGPVAWRVTDATRALPEGRFDVIILSNVIEHLKERTEFLRRLCRSAEPKSLLIRVPLYERDWRVPVKRELGVEWRLDPGHETEYTLESFAAEMTAAGLALVHQEVRWGEIWAEVRPC